MKIGGYDEYDHIIERRQRRDNERVNLNTIKQAIDRKLQSSQKSRTYWEMLALFLQSKLSKMEWDHTVKVLLGADFIPLHNYFIRCLIFNARSTHSIPIKEPTKPVDLVLYKKIEKKKNLLLRNRVTDTSLLDPIPNEPLTAGIAFPDRDIVRNKMTKLAHETGVTVPEESVTYVQRALEFHLKNILAKIIAMKKLKTTEALLEMRSEYTPPIGEYCSAKTPLEIPDVVHSYSHYLDDIPYMRNVDANGKPYDEEEDDIINTEFGNRDQFVITPRDMYTLAQCSPSLITSERVREHILMSDWDLYN